MSMIAARRTCRRQLLLSGLFLALLMLGTWLHCHSPFQDRLGTFATSLSDRTPSQRHNIRLAVQALDAAIIEPGAVFSFNARVGPRSLARGYRRAEALMEGELVSSIGGGICQTSSTLYNAALLAGLHVRQRVPHAWAVRSVPPGRDATVWYGKADLILFNDHSHPVRLHLEIAGERLLGEVWGTRQAAGENVYIQVQVLEVLLPPVLFRYDPGLERGRQVVVITGSPGYRLRTLRGKAHPGYPLRQEIISRDTYRARPRVVRVGTRQ